MTQQNPLYTLPIDRIELRTLDSELQQISTRLCELSAEAHTAMVETTHLLRRVRALLQRAEPLHKPDNTTPQGGN